MYGFETILLYVAHCIHLPLIQGIMTATIFGIDNRARLSRKKITAVSMFIFWEKWRNLEIFTEENRGVFRFPTRLSLVSLENFHIVEAV